MDFKKYFAAASNAPQISSADVAEILSSGHPDGEEKVARSYQRLVCSVVRKWRRNAGRYGIDVMDLVQDGNRGLLLAMRSYDAAKGVPFAAWAWNYIKSYVEKEFYAQLSVGRLAGKKLVAQHQKNKERDAALGRTTEPLDIRPEVPFSAMTACGDGVDNDGGEKCVCFEDALFDSPTERWKGELKAANILKVLAKADGAIHPRAKKIVEMRFGVGEFAASGPRSFSEVAESLRIPRGSVRKIGIKALAYLRAAF
ncbi:MAG: hypothetical protein CVU77_04460 [Elusimicrobia bacterium HGW-Elusimicrobia-1]|jgi:RNA polymerase sigma factor (sigma-70 family)|nr:MAG: hypothetical protein CVU77_04460 [Elusimicrobia bacterium HGW-Elusimicrobia-1]